MKIEVLSTQWSHDDGVLAGGEHEIAKPSKALLVALASAESIGAVKIVEANATERKTMDAAIESDEDSQKIYDKAQADSSWHVGNLNDYIAVKSALLDEYGDDLPEETVASLELGIAQSKQILELLDEGKSYDDAVTEVLNG